MDVDQLNEKLSPGTYTEKESESGVMGESRDEFLHLTAVY